VIQELRLVLGVGLASVQVLMSLLSERKQERTRLLILH
tara:strand:- start:90 stop:203 length:114 start_codon:yes stop_codon:yes gene_type:complete